MSWSWEYAFGAEQSAKTAPAPFLAIAPLRTFVHAWGVFVAIQPGGPRRRDHLVKR